MTEVTMYLTDKDIENVNHLKDVWKQEEIDCVSDALSLMAGLVKLVRKGDQIMVYHKAGGVQSLDIPGVNVEE